MQKQTKYPTLKPKPTGQSTPERTVHVFKTVQLWYTLQPGWPLTWKSQGIPKWSGQGSQEQEVKFQDPIFSKSQDNFRTFLSVSRGSRHRKCTFFCPHKCYQYKN